jgi:hypothetical protein
MAEYSRYYMACEQQAGNCEQPVALDVVTLVRYLTVVLVPEPLLVLCCSSRLNYFV